MISDLGVNNGLRMSLHSHWVVVRCRVADILNLLKRWLHLHNDQAGPWRSGPSIWRVGALLNHGYRVIILKSSAHTDSWCLSYVMFVQDPQDCLLHVFVFCSFIFTCFHTCVQQLGGQRVFLGPQDSFELPRMWLTLKLRGVLLSLLRR